MFDIFKFSKKGGFGLDPVVVGRGKRIERNLPRYRNENRFYLVPSKILIL